MCSTHTWAMPPRPGLERLSATFRRFGQFEAIENRSPLYAVLSNTVADDTVLLELASHAAAGQPPPNLLFAAVQYLLAAEPSHPLAAAYPALAAGREPPADVPALFRGFCHDQANAIIPILQTRLVQTNEVRRSAVLLPAFIEVGRRTRQPLALVEIGPSAGLNLLFDRYDYHYGPDHTVGTPASLVHLDSEWQGSAPPPDRIPAVASRMGIDLNPLDVRNDDDVRWLRALIWPEHDDRRHLLDMAIATARADPPRLLGGDLFQHLPRELAATPPNATATLFATFVLNQFSQEMCQRLDALLREASRTRDIHMVIMGSAEAFTGERDATAVTSIWLTTYTAAGRQVERLARANPHGRWIAWAG